MVYGVRTLLLLAMLVIHCAGAIAQVAQDQKTEFDFDIKRIGMSAALHELSQHSGLNVGWFPESDAEAGTLVGPLQGRFTGEQALARLLVDTGYTYEWLNGRSLYVFRRKQEASAAPAQDPTASSDSHRGRRPVESGNIIVIASRLGFDAALLSTTELRAETIESYGVSTLAELLSYLPQFPNLQAGGSRVSGEQYADLRGFGAGATLVLINGRRVGASAMSLNSSAFDLNSIPLPAVERIEIFLDSHPIWYGADAMGGVVNVVLKEEMPEPIVQLKYGAAKGGAEEARGSLGIGISNDRFRGAATLDYFHRGFLMGSERELTSNQDFRRFGRLDMRSLDAIPPNISSLTPGRNLPGLSSPFAAVPPGGDNLTIADFNAGQRNLVSLMRFQSIVPQATRASAVGNLQVRLTDHVELFSEILFIDREDVSQFGPPAVRGAVVSAANPFNPFGESVAVNALVTGVDPTRLVTETSVLRAVLGANATVNEWTTQAYATWHEDDAHASRENELDPTKVMQALVATDADIALNFFRDGPPGSAAFLRSLRADHIVDHFESEYLHAHFSAQGRVVDVPAGELRLLLGSEWRREVLSVSALPPHPALRSLHRTTSGAFGQVRLPFVSPEMAVPAATALDLTIGLRGDHGDFGTGVSAQYAVTWQPMSLVNLNLFYRDFYRQPNLYDLYNPRALVGHTQLLDPRRNNESSPVAVVAGGNASLVPTSGHGWGARLEYTASKSLNFSAGYWHTEIQDRIAYLPHSFALAHEAQFPDRVVRADPTLQDLAFGMPGHLVSVSIFPGNLSELEADGVDFAVKSTVSTRFGRLSPALTATWNHSYTTVFAPGMEPEQRVGIATDSGTNPRWRGVASVGLERAPWFFFCAARFVSEYDDAFFWGAKNGRSVPANIQFDAQVSVQLDRFTKSYALEGFRLTAGAINLLDAAPDYSEAFGPRGYDHKQADLRQRFWYLGAEKSF